MKKAALVYLSVLIVCCAGAMSARAQEVTFMNGNQPAQGISWSTFAFEGKAGTAGMGATGTNGMDIDLTQTLSNWPMGIRIWPWVCPDNKTVKFVPQGVNPDQVPPPCPGAKRMGGYFITGKGRVTLNLATGTVSQSSAGGGASETGISYQIRGYGGVGFLASTNTPAWAVHFAADIPLGRSPIFFAPGAGYEDFLRTTVSSIGSMTGGPTGSTFATTADRIQGGFIDASIGVRAAGFRVEGGPGLLVSSVTSKTTSGFCGGSLGNNCETTSVTSSGQTVPRFGVGAEVAHRLFSFPRGHVEAGFRYQYESYNVKDVGGVNIVEGELGVAIGH